MLRYLVPRIADATAPGRSGLPICWGTRWRAVAAVPQPTPDEAAAVGGQRTAWAILINAVKGTVFGAMAATVPAKDREFFARRWGFVLPCPTRAGQAGQHTGTGTHSGHTTTNDGLAMTAVDERSTVQSAAGPRPSSPDHALTATSESSKAIMGDLVVDLGYKQVVRCSLQELLQVKVWEKQRILRQERCKRIAKAKLAARADGEVVRLPGVMTLFHDVASGDMGILDGQHRLGALMLLCEEGEWPLREPNIVVDVFSVRSETEVKALFTEINSAEPVRLVDMPSEGMDDVLKTVLSEAVEQLAEEQPEMFKSSHRCRPPHVNKDNLRDEIYQSEFMTRHGINTTAQLLAALREVNGRLAKRAASDWTEENCRLSPKLKTFASALEKAHAHKFYLGMDTVWART